LRGFFYLTCSQTKAAIWLQFEGDARRWNYLRRRQYVKYGKV